MSALGRVVSVEEDVEALRSVTVDDVATVVQRVLGGPRSVAVVGPQDDALDRALAAFDTPSRG